MALVQSSEIDQLLKSYMKIFGSKGFFVWGRHFTQEFSFKLFTAVD